MGLRNGISSGIRKKHIRIGNKFDGVEGVTCASYIFFCGVCSFGHVMLFFVDRCGVCKSVLSLECVLL